MNLHGEHEVEACALMGSKGLRVYKDYDEQGKALRHDMSNAKRMLQRTPKTMAPIMAAGDPLRTPRLKTTSCRVPIQGCRSPTQQPCCGKVINK